MSRRRWWVMALVGAWVLVLLGAAVWSAQRDDPTVREQTTLAEGRAGVDRAVDTLLAAVGPDLPAELAPRQELAGCRITAARRGTDVSQQIVLTVPEGGAAALFDRLVAGVPAEWQARRRSHPERFRADAGGFVTVRGEVAGSGEVRLTVRTGCRDGGG